MIFNCLDVDSNGNVSTEPMKNNQRNKYLIPKRFRKRIMSKCLDNKPEARPTFDPYIKNFNLIITVSLATFFQFVSLDSQHSQ